MLKNNNNKRYSRYTDKGAVFAERFVRTIKDLIRKPRFDKGNADLLSELPPSVKIYNDTIHHSKKLTPIQASKKANEKEVFSNLKDKREKRQPNFSLRDLVRSSDIRSFFSKGVSTNYSNKVCTIMEKIHDAIPSCRINYLPEKQKPIFIIPNKINA